MTRFYHSKEKTLTSGQKGNKFNDYVTLTPSTAFPSLDNSYDLWIYLDNFLFFLHNL